MHVLAEAFWLPKAGHTLDEYEDAFWPAKRIDQGAPLFRCAVADGATEASFSGLWARMLVQAYSRGDFSKTHMFFKRLTPLQQKWRATVSRKPLPWYAEEKIRQGAFSSLMGFTLRGAQGEDQLRWDALAIGDSCLFQIRGDEVIRRFPLTSAEQFDNRPALLASNPAGNSQLASHIRFVFGHWHDGDAFYLMTDALACWFLKAVDREQFPWWIIRDLGTEDGRHFEEWVTQLRQTGQLSNDDVTLFRIDASVDMI
jgi:hypothetical protein